ncbi:acyl-CoA dehydrogenase [Desulfocicer vacuolatum DSM 3385]|uniref:Acyl-[acyl-carrier-protein] dehydrogenase MbtN n=1 Tax=Desulfocicer vacuolatum DSM 3385 TaxID=1121400 RepID=A0A1W2D5V7_9BACT|nr:acyl-CoA dehydrogenase family protein [Desulfocicer vacuolatum]SMC92855.1 acyl-CoA dehydrogenase [Desulfocicer vacuolatum DSM 3385]
MEIINYTDEHHEYRQRFRSFLETDILPHKNQWDNAQLIPKDIWKKLGKNGFLCPTVEKAYGGAGQDFLYSVIVIEEIARANYLGLFAYLHSEVVVPYITAYATEAQKMAYLPGCVVGDIITAVAMTEPDAGSDLASMVTTAVEQDDHIIINGSKTFISNGVNCDLIVLAARDPQEKNPHKAISLFLVEADTPGLKKGVQFEKMGMHSQDTTELFFNNCKIPVSGRLGPKGAGFKLLMNKLQQERLVCAVSAVACSEFCLEWTVNYFRQALADKSHLARSQASQFALAEMVTELKMEKAFVNGLVLSHMAGENVILETSMAKFSTTDSAKRISSRCMDLLEEMGGIEGNCPLVDAFNDVRVLSIYAGTNEIMKQIIAKELLSSSKSLC